MTEIFLNETGISNNSNLVFIGENNCIVIDFDVDNTQQVKIGQVKKEKRDKYPKSKKDSEMLILRIVRMSILIIVVFIKFQPINSLAV